MTRSRPSQTGTDVSSATAASPNPCQLCLRLCNFAKLSLQRMGFALVPPSAHMCKRPHRAALTCTPV